MFIVRFCHMSSEQDKTKETDYFACIYNKVFGNRRKEIRNELILVFDVHVTVHR
jgi:16S rRNA A1518/A1519 N6-dimethyltransferase RsmA/KsgA/DIM1 with predicted DNA glycosylase/AP lyase activity